MSAGGEAVAWQERAAGGVESNWFACSREEYERLKDSRLYEVRALYATSPATIPVEALEELVEKWRTRLDDVIDLVPNVAAELLNECADELTQLIKERSNECR